MHLQLKLAAATLLDSLGALAWLRRSRSAGGLVLTFHRVLEDSELGSCYEPHIALRAPSFAALLELLRAEYQVVPLEELLEDPASTRRGRPRVGITFDDGWEDTCTVAAPLLAAYGMPATVFLCSALIDQGTAALLPEERFARIWRAAAERQQLQRLLGDLETWRVGDGVNPDLHAWGRRLKRLPLSVKLILLSHLEQVYQPRTPDARRFLTWDQARSMQKDGIRFGSHTAHHVSLDAEALTTVLDELTGSRATIERELGEPCRTLAYPNGAYNSRVAEAAHQAGYRYALTTEHGFIGGTTDALAIPRLSIGDPVVQGEDGRLHPARTRLYLQQLRAVRSPELGISRPLQSLAREQAPGLAAGATRGEASQALAEAALPPALRR